MLRSICCRESIDEVVGGWINFAVFTVVAVVVLVEIDGVWGVDCWIGMGAKPGKSAKSL